MRKRLLYGAGIVLLLISATLVVWQGSFSFGDYSPASPEQTYLFWAVSTLVFLLMVTLSFMLFRAAVRLYIERRSNREGSRIRVKMVLGALALTFIPVTFLVLWSVSVLNRNLDKWFSRPAELVRLNFTEIGQAVEREVREKARMQAAWLTLLPETHALLDGGFTPLGFFERVCRENGIGHAILERTGREPVTLCSNASPASRSDSMPVSGTAAMGPDGRVVVYEDMPLDLTAAQQEIQRYVGEYNRLAAMRKEIRNFYILLLLLITLFVLFVATWMALYLARQISIPISALLGAAGEVRRGNLGVRVEVRAIDELASLVRAFNEMTRELEANSRELESRRRFTETILESIPTGVISLSSDGRILRVNRALSRIFPETTLQRAARLEDLFSREDAAEIRYLTKRARRTGVASRQIEFKQDRQTLHLSVTASALEEKPSSGFVLVIEDSSELLRAQKAAAWHEVARRVAHEIKNPLTPIALCAERINRQLERVSGAPDTSRILRECAATIGREIESVKTLVDEFSQFARFPAAQPAPCDLNDVVREALGVFAGRLDGIQLHLELAEPLPPVNIDREQFKRVVVNLVDNAAEAMQESLVKHLLVATQAASADTVELVIADSGCGISQEDREKLFLPYFSTKGRGTGLGLAIVNRILSDHNAHIRVEDNVPTGARFLIEVPAFLGAEQAARTAVVQA